MNTISIRNQYNQHTKSTQLAYGINFVYCESSSVQYRIRQTEDMEKMTNIGSPILLSVNLRNKNLRVIGQKIVRETILELMSIA